MRHRVHFVSKWLILASAFAITLTVAHDASAQSRGRWRKRTTISAEPALSPYLTLLNPNAPPGLNYAALAAPMLRQQELNQQNQQTLRGLQGDAEDLGAYAAGGIRATGHRSSFMNYSHYYGGGLGGGGGGGSGGFQRRRGSSSGGGGGFGGIGVGFY